MSRGNKTIRDSKSGIRGGSNVNNPGVFKGTKFVKRAGMTIEYENYNTKSRADKQVFK